ncbi:MAG: phytanoyl-CoA dioxygenase family protein [Alphaproteobacteria bacterium]
MIHPKTRPTAADRDTFERDGAVCLRGVYAPDVIAALLATWDAVAADPYASGLVPPGEEHREVGDRANIISRPSHGVAAFRDFIRTSPVPALLGDLLGAREVGFYWDTVFAKDPGSPWPTTWHTDAGATAILGNQLLNVWTPLTPVTRENSLEILAGSHKTDVLYWPRSPNGARLSRPADRPWCPDFEAERGNPAARFIAWDMEPGDVVVMHLKTAHYNRGNPTAQRRVAYATWWYGDDVVWDPRPECEAGHPEAPFAAMPRGERPNHPLFPILWRAAD